MSAIYWCHSCVSDDLNLAATRKHFLAPPLLHPSHPHLTRPPSISSWRLAEDRLSVIPSSWCPESASLPSLSALWLTVHQSRKGAAKRRWREDCGGLGGWLVNHVEPDVAPQISRWVLRPDPHSSFTLKLSLSPPSEDAALNERCQQTSSASRAQSELSQALTWCLVKQPRMCPKSLPRYL